MSESQRRYVVRVRETIVREAIVEASSKREAREKARAGVWITAGNPECLSMSLVGKVYVEGGEQP